MSENADSISKSKPARLTVLMVVVLIFLGIVVRSRQLMANRSFWYDELLIAVNIQDKNFLELWGHLNFSQVAPIIYLWTSKLSTATLGNSEVFYRLPSYLAGIFTLGVLAVLGRKLDQLSCIFLLFWASFSPALVYYSTELKPYAWDAFYSATLLTLGYDACRNLRREFLITWALVGVLAIWSSITSIIVLAPTGLVAWIYALREHRWPALVWLTNIGILWIANWLASYLLVYTLQLDQQGMTHYWISFGGLNSNPSSIFATMKWLAFTWNQAVENPFGFQSISAATLCMGLGAFVFLRQRPLLGCMMLSTALTALVMANFQLYPFKERTILFLTPLFLVLVSVGMSQIVQQTRQWGQPWPLLAGVWIFATLAGTYYAGQLRHQFLGSHYREEIKDVMLVLDAKITPGDHVYVTNPARNGFSFYQNRYSKLDGALELFQRTNSEWSFVLRQPSPSPPTARFWIVHSHFTDDPRNGVVKIFPSKEGGSKLVYLAPGAALFEFEPKQPPATSNK